MKTNPSLSNKANLALAILNLFLIVFTAIYTWHWADDFCLLRDLENSGGVFKYLVDGYMNWDGRYFSIPAIFQISMIKYLPAEFSNIVWSISFIISLFLIARIVFIRSGLKYKSATTLIFTGLYATAAWQGIKPYISEVVYWSTGGAYSMHLLIGMLFMYVYFTYADWFSKNNRFLLIGIMAVCTGATAQNLALGLLAFLFVDILTKNSAHRNIKIASIIGIIAGLAIISFAPGNLHRASHADSSFNFSVLSIIENFTTTSQYFIRNSWVYMLYTLIVTPLFFLTAFRISIAKNMVTSLFREAFSLNNIRWLAASLGSILPFIVVPDFVSRRTTLYFAVFLSMYAMHVMVSVFAKNDLHLNKKSLIAQLGISIIILVNIVNVISESVASKNMKEVIIQREAYLENITEKNKMVYIDVFSYKDMPMSRRFSEVGFDTSAWRNDCLAEHYGFRAVSAGGNILKN